MGFVFLPSNRVERVLLTSVIERTSSINRTHWKIPARLCVITEPIEQQSGLTGRKQRVLINDHTSDDFHLSCGVPQGSCVGPILFILYISRLYHVIANHLPSAHGYADDTQLYLSFRPNDRSSQDYAIASVEACISDVRAWLIHNRLLIKKN